MPVQALLNIIRRFVINGFIKLKLLFQVRDFFVRTGDADNPRAFDFGNLPDC